MDSELLKQTTLELLEALDANVESITISDGHRTVIAVDSPDSALLVGPRGEHLQALNTILKRLMEGKIPDSNGFLLDIGGYLEAQMEPVRTQARIVAQRVRLFKRDAELEPMNPYQRLVVHELFADDPDIETHSEGEGKLRRIVLKYKK